jgi:hypothetical protein
MKILTNSSFRSDFQFALFDLPFGEEEEKGAGRERDILRQDESTFRQPVRTKNIIQPLNTCT